MDWKKYFQLAVYRENLKGTFPYFNSELRISTDFSIDEILPRNFQNLNLSPEELGKLSAPLRKILLRLNSFNSFEFNRIALNFLEKVSQEKDQLLTFSTQGGGIYLFSRLAKFQPELLQNKKLICYTNELPLLPLEHHPHPSIIIIHRPNPLSRFRDFPHLCQNLPDIDLYEESLA